MWDDLLVDQRIDTMPNYTTPLPTQPTPSLPPSAITRNRHIESALAGAKYDPYVRWIVLEGMYGWWANELEEWTTCPQFAIDAQPGQTVLSSSPLISKPPFEDPMDVPVCPYHWAAPSHQMICDFIWRPDLEGVKDPKQAKWTIVSLHRSPDARHSY
jgi:hypothetical protein